MTDLAAILGANLRRIRGSMTQEAFEEATGLSQGRLSELERGKGWSQIQGIAERLERAGIEPTRLLDPGEPAGVDPAAREVYELFLRASPTVRQGLLIILRDYVAMMAGRSTPA